MSGTTFGEYIIDHAREKDHEKDYEKISINGTKYNIHRKIGSINSAFFKVYFSNSDKFKKDDKIIIENSYIKREFENWQIERCLISLYDGADWIRHLSPLDNIAYLTDEYLIFDFLGMKRGKHLAIINIRDFINNQVQYRTMIPILEENSECDC